MRTAKAALAAALLALGGCSWVPNAVNPVAWYRDLSGASKNDALDKDQRNQQNLAAGGQQPYPNLADVPDVPDRALSTIDREALQKTLLADRANAQYTDEQLRAGATTPGLVQPPPPAPAGAAGTGAPRAPGATPPAAAPAPAAPPVESSLVSPTIPSVPTGETPPPPPAPPALAARPPVAAPRPPVAAEPIPPPAAAPTQTASLAPGGRRGAPAASVAVAEIDFAGGSAALTDVGRNRLSEVAATQHKDGGTIRIVGHGDPAAKDAAQQPLASFTLALNRAKAVAAELGVEGVAAGAIAIETAPSGQASTAPPRADIFLEH